jgi:DNA-binding transcriptional MocR family regulator
MPYPLTWKPVLEDSPRSLVERLLMALERDVRAGVLAPGLRLPPQRELAYALGISLGTVTKAYAEAERRGLTEATVGRGTFIRIPRADDAFRLGPRGLGAGLNLAQNVRPVLSSAVALGEALGKLRRKDLALLTGYGPAPGEDAHRRAMALWLERTTLLKPDWRRLAITNGAQQALALALGAVTRPGDMVMTEQATYFGLRTLAEHMGLRLKGLAIDREGLLPEALDRAAAQTGARVVCLTPTLHNPTGRTLGRARREEIVRVARARDLILVEDDVYALYDSPRGLAPLAALAPERTFYVTGLSKALSPGLRCGMVLAAGAEDFERIVRALRATCYAPSSLGPAIASQWIEDGTAETLAAEVKAEMGRRTRLALRLLGQAAEPPAAPGSLHLWLPMPALDAERCAAHALRAGVQLTPPGAPIVEGDLAGVRVCLGGPDTIGELEGALKVVAEAVGGSADVGITAMV